MLDSFFSSLVDNYDLYWKSVGETAAMVIYSLFFSSIIGLFLGICLVVLRPGHIYENKAFYPVLNAVINILRSVPFIIILIAIIPITKFIVHTTIGVKGVIVPLVFYTSPYIARLVESALLEVNPGVIEAFQSMGASRRQIIWRVMLKEARPGIVLGMTTATIGLIGATAMAGMLGAGGLGDVAIRFGYQRWQPDVMYVCVFLLIVIVQLIQSAGTRISKKLRKH